MIHNMYYKNRNLVCNYNQKNVKEDYNYKIGINSSEMENKFKILKDDDYNVDEMKGK